LINARFDKEASQQREAVALAEIERLKNLLAKIER